MTLRQKKALRLVETGRSMKEVMIQAGYSPITATHPKQKLTSSKGWNKALDKALPDNRLLKKHNELLDKQEYIAIGKAGEREVVPTGEIDANAVAKGLDMAYKLKNKYPKEGGININEAKILVMPAELIEKYDLPSNASDSSK